MPDRRSVTHGVLPVAAQAFEPDHGARAHAMVQDMYVWLLTGYAADAVIRATEIVDVALHVIAGGPRDRNARLGTLIDTRRRARHAMSVAEANWLRRIRIAMQPLTGQICPAHDEDARRASEMAVRLAQYAGLVTAAQAAACESSAAWQASERASQALLRLDRAPHRKALEDRLDPPPRVLVVMVHGEVGQGHDHFAEIISWRLRSASSSPWREVSVAWPPPSRSLGVRLAMLFDALARRLGVALNLPPDDPTSPGGALVWQPALARLVGRFDAMREPVLLRHVVGSLGSGAGGDDILVDAYVRTVWNAVAQRAGERILVSLDVRRIERSGFPLTWPWRHARRDLATARAVAKILDVHHRSRGGVCVALPELTSVRAPDLADWLHDHGGRDRDTARLEARQLVASTRGGRFDLVVQRLTALQLDHKRSPR